MDMRTKGFTMLMSLIALTALVAAGCGGESAKCGNGKLESGEVCDGTDFGADNCQMHGYLGGLLTCTDACDNILFTRCTGGCGNGSRDSGEECDTFDFGGDNCQLHGYDYGTLTCTSTCTIDESTCQSAVCGNGEVEETEECEPGTELGRTCEDFYFNAGTLACYEPGTADECHFDISGCQTWECGNGVIDPGENCDFDGDGNELLDEETCITQGYDFGELHCVPADSEEITRRCRFDVDLCGDYECGNGELEGDEQCETGVTITATCADEGFESGDLACRDDGTCLFDYSACVNGCGNGLREGDEECDGDDIGGQDCASISGGTYTGTLRCLPDCTFDLSMCVEA
jgi:hypothetical protein